LVLIPKRVFSKEDTKSTKFKNKISETFVAFVSFVVRKYYEESPDHNAGRNALQAT